MGDRERADQLRSINTKLRREMPHGNVVISGEVAVRYSNDQFREITKLIRYYDAFGADSDPEEWHDHVVVEFEGDKLDWQIDV